MIAFDYVEFKGKTYPRYELEGTGMDEPVIVSVEELNDEYERIMEFGSNNQKNKISIIDEEIYCYMPKEILEKSEEEVLEYFKKHYD